MSSHSVEALRNSGLTRLMTSMFCEVYGHQQYVMFCELKTSLVHYVL